MSEVAFLVNPAAANGRTGRRWPELARRAAEQGLEGPAYLSQRGGHLVELADEAAEKGAELLVIVGGDGTVNEVARGLLARHERGKPVPEIAVVPQGTGPRLRADLSPAPKQRRGARGGAGLAGSRRSTRRG